MTVEEAPDPVFKPAQAPCIASAAPNPAAMVTPNSLYLAAVSLPIIGGSAPAAAPSGSATTHPSGATGLGGSTGLSAGPAGSGLAGGHGGLLVGNGSDGGSAGIAGQDGGDGGNAGVSGVGGEGGDGATGQGRCRAPAPSG